MLQKNIICRNRSRIFIKKILQLKYFLENYINVSENGINSLII